MDAGTLETAVKIGVSGLLGGLIGWERRAHHKPIGIAGTILVAIGSTTYMVLAEKLSAADPSSVSCTLQGFLSGIGFLGDAVILGSPHRLPKNRPLSGKRQEIRALHNRTIAERCGLTR